MLGELLKAAFGGSIWMLQGGLGTPEYFFLPVFPPGSPCPAPTAPRHDAVRHPAPACSLQPLTVESDNALGEAQGDRLAVDIVVWAERGRGKRTPVITSPLSFDLTGVRFQRRARLARGPPNPSALSTYHPTARSGMAKPPRSKGLALTAHIGTYALPGRWFGRLRQSAVTGCDWSMYSRMGRPAPPRMRRPCR